jgi:hypothetical protein
MKSSNMSFDIVVDVRDCSVWRVHVGFHIGERGAESQVVDHLRSYHCLVTNLPLG